MCPFGPALLIIQIPDLYFITLLLFFMVDKESRSLFRYASVALVSETNLGMFFVRAKLALHKK